MNRNCSNWTEAIAKLGCSAAPSAEQVAAEAPTPVAPTRSAMAGESLGSTEILKFQTNEGRYATISKVVLDVLKNRYATQLRDLEIEYKSRLKKANTKRKPGAPNTTTGLDMTIGGIGKRLKVRL